MSIYKNKLKSFSITHQIQFMEQQLNTQFYELNLLKGQHQKQQENLQVI